MSAKLPAAIVAIAAKELGVEEVNGSNCGPRVDVYKAACPALPADESWPWCSAFCCWVVRQAMQKCGIVETATFRRPTTAAAWGWIGWSISQDQTTHTRRLPGEDIQSGDILVYTFSHVGIATAAPSNGRVATIEGNTDAAGSREGGGVFAKCRRIDQVRARIRFMV